MKRKQPKDKLYWRTLLHPQPHPANYYLEENLDLAFFSYISSTNWIKSDSRAHICTCGSTQKGKIIQINRFCAVLNFRTLEHWARKSLNNYIISFIFREKSGGMGKLSDFSKVTELFLVKQQQTPCFLPHNPFSPLIHCPEQNLPLITCDPRDRRLSLFVLKYGGRPFPLWLGSCLCLYMIIFMAENFTS